MYEPHYNLAVMAAEEGDVEGSFKEVRRGLGVGCQPRQAHRGCPLQAKESLEAFEEHAQSKQLLEELGKMLCEQ
jgi:hypothetical protein